jgi:hypothetical protein
LLRVKLRALDRWNDARRDIARRYVEGLRGADVALPDVRASEHVVHLFVVRSRQRQALQADLEAQRIGCAIHYPIPDYRQPVLAPSPTHPALPFTEAACSEVLTLPCHPGLADADARGSKLCAGTTKRNAWPPPDSVPTRAAHGVRGACRLQRRGASRGAGDFARSKRAAARDLALSHLRNDGSKDASQGGR